MVATNVIVLGATGEVGRQAIASALAAPATQRVYSFGRRPPPLPTDAPGLNKLHHAALDFDKLLAGDALEGQKLSDADADAVVICLGTTRGNAGSAEQFIKVDREYVLAAAKYAKKEGKQQRLVYCSSGGSSSSSLFLYPKSKGLTEEGLAALSYSETIIMRPGLLVVPGGRGEHRLPEVIASKITGVLSKFSDSVEASTPSVGSAMVRAALEGSEALSKAGLGHEEILKGHKAWVMPNAAILRAMRETNK